MKKESVMQKLFTYAGNYKYLTIASWILSATSALIALLPFYYIWRIMQEVVLAAPDYSKARNLSGLGWSGDEIHLPELGYGKIQVIPRVNEQVYSEKKKLLYRSIPMFLVRADKPEE